MNALLYEVRKEWSSLTGAAVDELEPPSIGPVRIAMIASFDTVDLSLGRVFFPLCAEGDNGWKE